MAVDEALFGMVFNALKRLRGRGPHADDVHNAVPLALVRDRLRVVASALCGRPITVQQAEHTGGLAGHTLLLPAMVNVSPDVDVNTGVYLWRAVFASLLGRLDVPLELGGGPAAVCVVPRVLRLVEAEVPRALGWFQAAAPAVLTGRAVEPRTSPWELLAQLVMGRDAATMGAAPADALAWAVRSRQELENESRPSQPPPKGPRRGWLPAPQVVLWGQAMATPVVGVVPVKDLPDATGSSGTQREGKAKEQLTRIQLDDEPEHENPMVHSFEKVHTAEEYHGGNKRADGDDDMAEQGGALDELDLRKVVQSNKRTRSVYRADVLLEVNRAEVGLPQEEGGIPYDEWDCSNGTYRPGWCRLYQRLGTSVAPHEATRWARSIITRHHKSVEELGRTFARLQSLRRWRGRLADGPDVDLDAMVDRHASLCAGVTPDHRLFGDRLRHGRSVAVMVLMDASLSTDSYVEGLRVMDVARDSVVVLGEALGRVGVPVAVASFHSNTRRDCRYVGIKGFNEPWEMAHQRLKPMVPEGYTRMGPALRHATHVLVQQPAHRRLLVLLSDGKPTDHDHYEGRHGIEDVRQAVREADAAGVHVFALAVDVRARQHLPRLFGHANYRVLPHPGLLPEGLAAVHARLLR